jgi:hypothetical protein
MLRWPNPGLFLLLAGGVTVAAASAPADTVADADLAAWVDRKVEQRQPAVADRRFDEVGWVKDLRTAERLAREHNRPVFLFTHDGRMNLGRC